MSAPRIYFYCSNEAGNLQEDVIALAEGLLELGTPYYSNCDYWLRSSELSDYLLKHDPNVTHEDCDIVVVSYTWPQWVRMGSFDVRRQPRKRFRYVGRDFDPTTLGKAVHVPACC